MLKQELTENSFMRQEEMIFAGCDSRGFARLSTLLNLMVAIAGHDYDARGLNYQKLFSIKEVFLLSGISLKVHTRPQTGDIVNVTTWENGTRGAYMRRNYEITLPDGTLLFSGKSNWILVNPETKRILRPSAFTGKKIGLCPREIDCPDCRILKFTEENAVTLTPHTVVYSDLDKNGHVYSGKYGDIIWDALPESWQEKSLKEFYIEYHHEAAKGEILNLKGSASDNTYTMTALKADGLPCFTCECDFA